jgi:heme/copper-type cytochrome/quinol oxidase subunit 1
MRAPGIGLMPMPLEIKQSPHSLLVAVMPVLAAVVTMMLMDLHFATSFFSAAGGGDPVLFSIFFWFFGHPGSVHHDPTVQRSIRILPAFLVRNYLAITQWFTR